MRGVRSVVRVNSTCMSTENINTPDRPTFMNYKKLLKDLQKDTKITFSDFILMPDFRGHYFTRASMEKAKQAFLSQAKAEKKRKKSQAVSKKSNKKKGETTTRMRKTKMVPTPPNKTRMKDGDEERAESHKDASESN